MTSVVVHLSQDADGQYICTDSLCGAIGRGVSPEASLHAWVDDVFHGYNFLMGHIDKLSPELEQERKDVERVFFPSREEHEPCQP